MHAIVLLNSAAGALALHQGAAAHEIVSAALSAAGIQAQIRLLSAASLAEEARFAASSEVDVVIVGGGDGTISTVAGAMLGSRKPLGILPLGTLNHFARDLGIPLDLPGATAVIAGGRVASIDVGEVNERVFINNSSLGVYPHMVLDREALRSRFGTGKWFAMLWAMFKTFVRFPLLKVRLTMGDKTVVRRSPLVFVGNNAYQLDLFHIGKRASLDRGELCLYVANAQTRWAMFKLTVRALFGRLKQARDFETFSLPNCLIESPRKRIHVAADGEVLKLKPPLQYRIRAGTLRVCLPEKPSGPASVDGLLQIGPVGTEVAPAG